MKTIAIYNIKGGVGKTAGAVNLAYLAATSGWRTLLCDLDPQGASTFYFRVRPPSRMKPGKLLKGGAFAQRQIRETDYPGLDLLPGHLAFRNLDLVLDQKKRSKQRIGDLLEGLSADYDLVVVDAPPNITLLSENLFHCADLVVVPVIPTTLSILTYDQIKVFFTKEGIPLERLRMYFSMAEKRKKLHRETIAQHLGEDPRCLPVTIPMASIVEQMGVRREPLPVYAPASPAGQAYRDLWSAVAGCLGLKSDPPQKSRAAERH